MIMYDCVSRQIALEMIVFFFQKGWYSLPDWLKRAFIISKPQI